MACFLLRGKDLSPNYRGGSLEVPPAPNVAWRNDDDAVRVGVKGETRAARNGIRQRHALPAALVSPLANRGWAVIPADDRRAESQARKGRVNRTVNLQP